MIQVTISRKFTVRLGEFFICWILFHFHTFKNFKVRRSGKKMNLILKHVKLLESKGSICVDDMYSKKDVNLSPKDHFMFNYFNLNHFIGRQVSVENT